MGQDLAAILGPNIQLGRVGRESRASSGVSLRSSPSSLRKKGREVCLAITRAMTPLPPSLFACVFVSNVPKHPVVVLRRSGQHSTVLSFFFLPSELDSNFGPRAGEWCLRRLRHAREGEVGMGNCQNGIVKAPFVRFVSSLTPLPSFSLLRPPSGAGNGADKNFLCWWLRNIR